MSRRNEVEIARLIQLGDRAIMEGNQQLAAHYWQEAEQLTNKRRGLGTDAWRPFSVYNSLIATLEFVGRQYRRRFTGFWRPK